MKNIKQPQYKKILCESVPIKGYIAKGVMTSKNADSRCICTMKSTQAIYKCMTHVINIQQLQRSYYGQKYTYQ